MAVLRLSFTNLCESATLFETPQGTQTSGFCSSEAAFPQRPFRTWRSTSSTGICDVAYNIGSSQTVDVIHIANVNFSCCIVQVASSSGFASANFNNEVEMVRNPLTWRWGRTIITCDYGGALGDWVRVRIAASTSPQLDGSTWYEIGGVWAGLLTSAPTHLQFNGRQRTVLPRTDVGPVHGGWRQRLKMGEPRAVIEGSLSAGMTAATPLLNDEADSWSEIFRQAWAGDYFLAYMNLGDPAQGYVVRVGNDIEYQMDGARALIPVSLEEVVGP